MSEEYEYKVFTDNMKRNFLLNEILNNEVLLYQLTTNEIDPRLPGYDEWKYSVDETLKNLEVLKKTYEDLNGSYDLQVIRNVINNPQQ